MKYALNLDTDRRILSATTEEFATPEMPIVDSLPEGDICDYIYTAAGEYEYSEAPWKATERIQAELAELHQLLNDTDYIWAKIAEGEATAEDYTETIARRKAARARIKELEN